jgi:uncharacterized 2Fe-2S/4Fe-4S cluster protein (DUF4445 family)
MSKRPLRVVFPELDRCLEADYGDNLLELMREAKITLRADCGGVGRCKSCRVVINGEVCAACLTHVMTDSEVYLLASQPEEDYAILAEYPSSRDEVVSDDTPRFVYDASARADCPSSRDAATLGGAPNAIDALRAGEHPVACAIAIDLGTTTVVGKLVERSTGRELASFSQLNAQVPYGADVLSRISAAAQDAGTLSALITHQIDVAIDSMLAARHVERARVENLVIAGNTTMSYILLGLPCHSLGQAPFKPAFTLKGSYAYQEVFRSDTLACACDVLPFISAYVGGDLVAGLCALGGEDDFILMDMGTNGELVFKRKDRLIATATAAGPAFEGGNIECGSGSTRGAISAVWYEGKSLHFKTIGAAPPSGICGSGILDIMAVLVREGLVDKTGLLSDSLADGRLVLSPASPDEGAETVYFSQKDVRQYQLAKSAIRTGFQILCEEMGGPPPAKVFLAGGFGQNLDPESAITTGLLPTEFRDRVVPIGNSSLNGAVKISLNESARKDVVATLIKSQEINLATHHRFNDLFMDYLSF